MANQRRNLDEETVLALFPLKVVAFPGALLPLHIFEPRYRQLVADRLEDDSPFGIVFGTDDDYAEIGCAVDIQGILQKLPDGKMNIITRGRRRFRTIKPHESSAPYAVVRAAWFDDDPEEVPAELVGRAHELFRRAAQAKEWGINLAVDVETDPAMLSWLIGGAMHLTNEARQELLELPSARKRLETIARWLNALLSG